MVKGAFAFMKKTSLPIRAVVYRNDRGWIDLYVVRIMDAGEGGAHVLHALAVTRLAAGGGGRRRRAQSKQ